MYDDENRGGSDLNNNYSYYDDETGTTRPTNDSSNGSYYAAGPSDGNSEGGGSYSGNDGGNKNKPKKKRSFGAAVGKAICLGLIFGLCASGVMYGFHKASDSSSTASATQTVNIVKTSTESVDTTDTSGVADIVDEVMPSIVAVNTTIEETSTDWFGRQYTEEGEGAGSGIIISSTDDYLYIITNYHVIEDSTTVSVQFSDNTTADASVKGYDENGDIAVLEIKMSDLSDDTKNTVKVAVLGDSDSLRAGESAIAIGNALGYGQSVTTGVISAVAKEVQLTDSTMTLIQTSAAINPGNSGGALLNGKGEVIGINSVKYADEEVEGMGFAIPINTAIETATGIIDGTIETKTDDQTAYLGISGMTITEDMSSQYNIPVGVYVASVETGSAAANAGIEVGSVITKFNDTDITSMDDLQNALSSCSPGDSVTLVVKSNTGNNTYDDGKEVAVVLGAKSDASSSASGSSASGSSQSFSGDSSTLY